MTLRTIHQATINTKRVHTKAERCACRGKIKQYTRSANIAGSIALKRSASAKRQCNTAWIARAVPQPGHFNPVSAKKGQRGKNLVSTGSNRKNSATPNTRSKNIPAGAAKRRADMVGTRNHSAIRTRRIAETGVGFSLPIIQQACSVHIEGGFLRPRRARRPRG